MSVGNHHLGLASTFSSNTLADTLYSRQKLHALTFAFGRSEFSRPSKLETSMYLQLLEPFA